MKLTYWILCLCLVFLATADAFAQRPDQVRDSLIQTVELADDPASKIESYGNLANYFIKYDIDETKFDSLHFKAMKLAEAGFDDAVILEAHINYLSHIEWQYDVKKCLDHIHRTEELLRNDRHGRQNVRAWLSISNAYWACGQGNESAQFAQKALNDATTLELVDDQINAYLAYSSALLQMGAISDAYRNLLKANISIKQLEDERQRSHFQYLLLDKLFDFHRKIKDFDKARNMKNEQLQMLTANNIGVDSTELMWLKFDILDIIDESKRPADILDQLDEIIQYAAEIRHEKLRFYALALYRSHMLDREMLAEISRFYTEKYPEEYALLEKNDPTRYCKISGILCENLNDLDSAQFYYDLEEQLHLEKNDSNYLANYYKRRGEFHLRHDQPTMARGHLQKAYDIYNQGKYTSETRLLDISSILESLEASLGNYEQAHTYAETIIGIHEKNKGETQMADLVRLEIESEEQERELLRQKKYEETKRKHKLQYLAIAIGILVLFVLMVIISSMQVPNWLIEMLGFFNVLFIWEFIIILLDHELHELTHGEPLKLFLIKVVIISVLFPLHHIVEKAVTSYLIQRKLITVPTGTGLLSALKKLWPWLERNRT